jgi:hypothetical protein
MKTFSKNQKNFSHWSLRAPIAPGGGLIRPPLNPEAEARRAPDSNSKRRGEQTRSHNRRGLVARALPQNVNCGLALPVLSVTGGSGDSGRKNEMVGGIQNRHEVVVATRNPRPGKKRRLVTPSRWISAQPSKPYSNPLGAQPCEEAYPADRVRQRGRLKQGTADGSRVPFTAATGRRRAVNPSPVRAPHPATRRREG